MLNAAPAVRDDFHRVNKAETHRITIILEDWINERIRAIAREKGVKVGPLLRDWIAERVQQELELLKSKLSD